MTTHTREQWLVDAVDILAEDLESIAPVPQDVAVVHGLPSRYMDTYMEFFVRGCCDHKPSTRVHVSSRLSNPIEVLSVLVHELIHASLGWGHGHGEVFEKPAREIGLSGELHATRPGPELSNRLNEISSLLGTYPRELV